MVSFNLVTGGKMPSNAIELRGLSKSFGEVTAVNQIDLDVHDGEFLTLLGPSGSGKTTVLRMIAGFEPPTSGSIKLDGVDVTSVAANKRDVNTVFQDYALFPHMTVQENVEYGLRVKGVDKASRATQAHAALEGVALAEYVSRKPSQLSGGQRQRVALARALVNKPKVLLLDEPLGALDLKLRQQMQSELKQIQREVGITFVFVTHDQEEALVMSDRIAVFNQGRIEQIDTAANVYEHPKTPFVAGFVGSSNMFSSETAGKLFGITNAFSLRPEKISIDSSNPTERSISGRISDIEYLGPMTRYVVDVPDSQIIVLEQNENDRFSDVSSRKGSEVKLSWRYESEQLLENFLG
jgi:putative spermidine/putrescine transport system ATP-binding protein